VLLSSASNLRTQSARGVRLAAMERRSGCATKSASRSNVGAKARFINTGEAISHIRKAACNGRSVHKRATCGQKSDEADTDDPEDRMAQAMIRITSPAALPVLKQQKAPRFRQRIIRIADHKCLQDEIGPLKS